MVNQQYATHSFQNTQPVVSLYRGIYKALSIYSVILLVLDAMLILNKMWIVWRIETQSILRVDLKKLRYKYLYSQLPLQRTLWRPRVSVPLYLAILFMRTTLYVVLNVTMRMISLYVIKKRKKPDTSCLV